MSLNIKSLFEPDFERYDGVRRINIYALRLLFTLMLVFLGKDSWTHILSHETPWEPMEAMAWSIWAAYASLALLGLLHPVKMIPLLLLEIFYKVLWLLMVAYPLWSDNQLAGSSAEGMTYAFLWVILAIIAVPWGYVLRSYLMGRPRKLAA
ncbi:MAG: hypothetical protein HYV16_14755 [Gammaproteobacteria bacterium]|nr:hypothetical protein [Gammaproteobacteria bacterium]